jgi:ribosomal protein S18 acetylase RimI-like enzyme
MTIDDYDSLYGIWTTTAGMGLNNIDDSRDGIGRYLARNPHTCFVAEESGKIVGGILCGHDGRRGMIHHTVVAEQSQRRGIGTALVAAALSALKAERITKVLLVVFSRNEGGNAFWKKQGFTERTDLVYRNKLLTELIRFDT